LAVRVYDGKPSAAYVNFRTPQLILRLHCEDFLSCFQRLKVLLAQNY